MNVSLGSSTHLAILHTDTGSIKPVIVADTQFGRGGWAYVVEEAGGSAKAVESRYISFGVHDETCRVCEDIRVEAEDECCDSTRVRITSSGVTKIGLNYLYGKLADKSGEALKGREEVDLLKLGKESREALRFVLINSIKVWRMKMYNAVTIIEEDQAAEGLRRAINALKKLNLLDK